MKTTKQTNAPDLTEDIKRYKLTYKLIQSLTWVAGMNNGKGYSYPYIRRVLVARDRNNAEIVSLTKSLIDQRKRYEAQLQSEAA